MKTFTKICILCLVLLPGLANAQCAAGYTQATLNWDNLDYYYNSGTNTAPYGFSTGTYVTNAMEMTQKFAIGANDLTIATSAAGMVKGDNTTQTSDITGYTGADAQFTPSAIGQTITITFANPVLNASFTLYDIDALAAMTLTAKDPSNNGISLSAATQGGTVLTITGNNTNTLGVSTLNATDQAVNSNAGTVTITVAGSLTNPVKSITMTFTTLGTNPTFWLSDIKACINQTFPTNYLQTVAPQPFTGMPDYFIVTPDNNNIYMLDPLTGKAYWLFQEVVSGFPYVNSFAYDPVNHLLYYVADGSGTASNNKALKVYDFNTETKSTVMADITTGLNIPTFNQGVESAAAAFYNGYLYLGIEGGQFNSSNTRETIIYKVTVSATGVPSNAVQVYATPSINGSGTSIHDWGDFLIKDGVVIDFNTARQGSGPYTYPNSSYVHYDMMTGNIANTYMNPGTNAYTGQGGICWNGDVYTIRNTVDKYNMAGATTTSNTIVVQRGPAWVGNAGDGSEPFRPKMDFGDAPSSYDPAAAPAVHEMDSLIRLGAGFDREWSTRGQTSLANSDNFDDAMGYVPTFNPRTGAYIAQISVFNNTGAAAQLVAWLDANGDGQFQASEGITMAIPTNAASQNVWLYFPGVVSPLTTGSFTYLRIRVARSGLTTSTPTGWNTSGEVEDYRVPVNDFPLAVHAYDLSASITPAKTVKIDWQNGDEANIASYVVEKSVNGTADWKPVGGAVAKQTPGGSSYELTDNSPAAGLILYRLRILQKDGSFSLSNNVRVDVRTDRFSVTLAPNPAVTKSSVYISSTMATEGRVEVLDASGAVVYKNFVQILKGTNEVQLPIVQKLASGRYLVRVTCGSESNTQSLMVNR